MKTIEYKAVWQSPNGSVVDSTIEVTAGNLNAGFRRATTRALKLTASRWHLVRVEFWQVTS